MLDLRADENQAGREERILQGGVEYFKIGLNLFYLGGLIEFLSENLLQI